MLNIQQAAQMSTPIDVETIRREFLQLFENELIPRILSALGVTVRLDTNQLSRRAAAKQLGVSIQTLDALVRDGSIEHRKVRRRVLIPEESLRKYLNRQPAQTERRLSR